MSHLIHFYDNKFPERVSRTHGRELGRHYVQQKENNLTNDVQ
jgi:hypothetical protein